MALSAVTGTDDPKIRDQCETINIDQAKEIAEFRRWLALR
jgi:uncharacterized protein (DUF305 family)